MNIYFKNRIDLYGQDFLVCFNEPSYRKILKDYELTDDESLDAYTGCAITFETGLRVIFIRHPEDINTIAHESFHLADRICEDVGIRYVHDSGNEAHAYLVGSIAMMVHKNATAYIKFKKSE